MSDEMLEANVGTFWVKEVYGSRRAGVDANGKTTYEDDTSMPHRFLVKKGRGTISLRKADLPALDEVVALIKKAFHFKG